MDQDFLYRQSILASGIISYAESIPESAVWLTVSEWPTILDRNQFDSDYETNSPCLIYSEGCLWLHVYGAEYTGEDLTYFGDIFYRVNLTGDELQMYIQPILRDNMATQRMVTERHQELLHKFEALVKNEETNHD